MPKKQSLFASQTRGLLLRTWHYQRREHASNFCNFIIPPLLLLLLTALSTTLSSTPAISAPERDPGGAFAARPFDPTSPLAPTEFVIPFHAPSSASAALGARDADAGVADGVLGGISLSPFVHPRANDPNQTWFDAVFLNNVGEMDRSNPVYKTFVDASATPGALDALYKTRTQQLLDKTAFEDVLFDSWFDSPPFGAAYGFNSVSDDGDAFGADVTVYYNESRFRSVNATVSSQIFASVARLDSAIFASQNVSAAAFLRRFPAVPTASEDLFNLAISIMIALFFHTHIPFFVAFLVYERQERLRELMAASGLRWGTYWFSTYIALYAQYLLTALSIIAVGVGAGVPFFTLNTPLSYLPLILLWGHLVVAHAIALAPFFASAETAVVLAWLILTLINFVGAPYILALTANDVSEGMWNAVMILPSFAFFRSVFYAGNFNSFGQGVTTGTQFYQTHDLAMCGAGPFCKSFGYLIAQWLVLMAAGLYLDQVFTDASGVRKHPLFFLGYQIGRGKSALVLEADSRPNSGELDDVAEERRYVQGLVAADPTTDPDGGVIVHGLHKIYTGSSPPVHAVRGVTFAARSGEICGLLGSNGSGKTSLIRCLIGAHAPSAGDAWLSGKSIRTGLKEIHSNIGICLQQDIQWERLSVEEHLYFFGRLRNIPKAELKDAVEKAMEGVDLLFARKRKSAQCSGGMRRRISVAMALLGSPKVVILDEPTGPLDPATTEKVWLAIAAAKRGKTIIITTHSMEEAKALCDRVHIKTRGQLRTTGNPEELRLRLGSGYRITASVPEASVADFHDMVMSLSSKCRVETQLGGNLNYSIPKSVALSSIFNAVAANKSRIGIRDWGVSQSSLEDVFLNVVARDELQVKQENEAASPENLV